MIHSNFLTASSLGKPSVRKSSIGGPERNPRRREHKGRVRRQSIGAGAAVAASWSERAREEEDEGVDDLCGIKKKRSTDRGEEGYHKTGQETATLNIIQGARLLDHSKTNEQSSDDRVNT